VVRRPRLTEKLNAGLAGKVTVLAAPAGFGKSTLLSEWIEQLRSTRDDVRIDGADESSLVQRSTEAHERQKSKIVILLGLCWTAMTTIQCVF